MSPLAVAIALCFLVDVDAAIDVAADAPALREGQDEGANDAGNTAAFDAIDAQLARGEVKLARAALAAIAGPLALEERARHDELSAVAAALDDDAAAAEAAFVRLLVIKPQHRLSYTRTPRVTFPYEKARRALAQVPALDVVVDVDDVLAWDVPLVVRLRASDAHGLLRRAHVCRAAKGSDDDACVDVDVDVAAPVEVALPALPAPRADAAATGRVVVVVNAYDARGDEVLRAPVVERPIGFMLPPPWWQDPWVLGPASALAAGVIAAGVVVGVIAAQPTESVLAAEVRR